MVARERHIVAGLVVLAALVVSRGSHAINGDAAYHLAISHSLVHDRDLDLRNQYDPNGAYLFRLAVEPGFADVGRGGRLYPREGIGFSIAMAPVFAAAEAVATRIPAPVLESVRWNVDRCARDLISFACAWLYAWVALLALRVARVVCGSDTQTDLPAILAFVTPPLLFVSILAFTEIPAAFLILWFVATQLNPARRISQSVWPLALLPWLHVRYVLVAMAGLAWMLSGERRRGGWRSVAPVLALPIASCALLAASRWWMFGTVMPLLPPDDALRQATLSIGGMLGVFLDRDFGLLWVAPFWVVALAGVARLRRTQPEYFRFAWSALIGLCLLTGLMGGEGEANPPGRLVVPMLPPLVPLLAEGLSRVARLPWRWPAYASFAWALMLSIVLIDRPGRMWNQAGDGISRIPTASVRRLVEPAARLSRMGIVADGASFAEHVREGNMPVVELFLGAGFKPEEGLVTAVQAVRADVLGMLLARMPEPGPEAGLALAWAKIGGHDALAGVLTAAGASLDSRNGEGATALMMAILHDRPDEQDLLIQSGADVNAATNTGQTALAVAVAKADAGAVARLIAAGADVNGRDADGWTPIVIAARLGLPAMVGALIAARADVDAMSLHGWTALMWAAYGGDLETVQALVASGADVSAQSKAGQTALIRGAEQGHLDLVRALVLAGADPRAEIDGADARAWAVRNGHAAVADFLEHATRSR